MIELTVNTAKEKEITFEVPDDYSLIGPIAGRVSVYSDDNIVAIFEQVESIYPSKVVL